MGESLHSEMHQVYELQSGSHIFYDQSSVLPPDIFSESMGYEGGDVINALRYFDDDPQKPMSVLELGVGSGVGLVGLLDKVKTLENVSLFGIDINLESITCTIRSIASCLAEKEFVPSIDIRQADWLDESSWEWLGERKYQVILFNPPYLPRTRLLLPGYEEVPEESVYTNDEFGLEHYSIVLPRLPGLLSEDEGSSLIVRFSKDMFSHKKADEILEVCQRNFSSTNVCLKREVISNRLGVMTTISRTEGYIPPHVSPTFQLSRSI